MLDTDQLDGFDWDVGNIDKNCVRHGVAQSECEEVFFNLPLLITDDLRHSQQEKRYYVLGQTNANRKLFLVFNLRETKIRGISARDMNQKERKVYEEANT